MRYDCAVWLAERPGLTAEKKLQILERLGTSEAVWNADEQELRTVGGMSKRQMSALLEKDLAHAQMILRDCERHGIRPVSIEEERYPQPLRDLKDAPLVLYVRGTLPDWSRTIAIGMVGTRRATEYGLRATRWLAGNLARCGCVIVSGMARGIDGESSRGAIEAGGIPVAVLGCGADVVYPPEHKQLMEDIIAHGAVVTEYPPGTEPRGWHFPQRNRIISGLSRGLIVIEAPKKSGALITADRALEQGRDVFAVPGSIGAKESVGTNLLIREGAAELVTCAADVLAHYPEDSKKLVPVQRRTERQTRQAKRPENKRPHKESGIRLSQQEQSILTAVCNGADSVDEIIDRTGMTASGVLAGLTMLEINGMVKRSGSSVQPAENGQWD